ncbi:MAG: GGDEF and EAL domain-containing protein [Alphaproteobacteria bacterium]|nr:GGDEF and EAL domain-containing protein [Alphaproteobacteria bacterium]
MKTVRFIALFCAMIVMASFVHAQRVQAQPVQQGAASPDSATDDSAQDADQDGGAPDASAPDAKAAKDEALQSVNFGSSDNVLSIKSVLTPYHAPGRTTEEDGSVWYMLQVTNDSVRPATRVLLAGQPPRMALSLLPHRTRPAILAVASSDSATVVETATAYGHRAWRVIVPPVTTVSLAVRVGNAATPPALFAWTEPALASHNRQLAIFITGVAALIGAAALIMGGLAVLIGHAAPRWVAVTLFLLLFSWLSGTGMFDASLATRIGGPYGLSAFLTVLSLVAGARLANAIIPLREIWPRHEKLFHRVLYGLTGLGALAYLGLPGATLLTDVAIVLGSISVAAYLIFSGRKGHKAAQVIAPSAAAFALVAMAAAVTAVGGLGESLTGPAATGGFAAAGAILLALAVIASEEIAVLPFLHGSNAARLLEAQADDATPIDAATPAKSLALVAIGASHQGIFNLDFRAGLLTLSPEAAQMVGLSVRETTISHSDWVGLIHPDDREVYNRALEEYRHRSGLAFRLEFRARGIGTRKDTVVRWRWLELRATIVTEEDVASDCLGLLSDITQRKEAEFAREAADAERARQAALPRDTLTGLGNRVALMEALDALGDGFGGVMFALLDIDRFKAIHASLGDAGADDLLKQAATRLQGLDEQAGLFRVGGDSFALLFTQPKRPPQAVGAALAEVLAAPYRIDGREVFAPCSVGLALGGVSEDPFALIKNAELALIAAKRQGGACARLYSRELENLAPGDSVALESELRHALAAGQLAVFYQPIIRLADRSVAGFEALLRWQHPTKGLIAPGDFIAHSEETGLIVSLGRFALERAAADLVRWQRYFPITPPLSVSVNLSRRQLKDAGFEKQLKDVLAQQQIAQGSLNLEITESAIAGDAAMTAALERIRALGVGLSLDDFGTGASSLSELKTLPVDTVKIDKSFLPRPDDAAQTGSDGEVVLTSIITMARDLKRAVVVEGIESEADAQLLERLGCEFGQGYFFAPALDAAAVLDFIARHYNITATTEPR